MCPEERVPGRFLRVLDVRLVGSATLEEEDDDPLARGGLQPEEILRHESGDVWSPFSIPAIGQIEEGLLMSGEGTKASDVAVHAPILQTSAPRIRADRPLLGHGGRRFGTI
jgi:hypothetical protein